MRKHQCGLGAQGDGHIFFLRFSPKKNEKELFTVVVHHNQFRVSARRIHQLLAPTATLRKLATNSHFKNRFRRRLRLLPPGADDDNPNRRSHSIVFNQYAIKKLCANYIDDDHASEEREAAAKKLFKHVGTVQQ